MASPNHIWAGLNTVKELAKKADIPSVINNLTSSSTTAALSANQGRLLNQSVSNGKTQVANAITGKGVAASGSDSFATLANKINQIVTGLSLSNLLAYGAGRDVARPLNITRKCNVVGVFDNNCAEFGVLDPSQAGGNQYTLTQYVGRKVEYGGVTYNYYSLSVRATFIEGYSRVSASGRNGTAYGYVIYV